MFKLGRLPTVIFAMLALLGTGCASVQVQKVENDRAVGPEGVRFYRPRPYIVVHEAFPLAAKPSIVQGRLTADGKYVQITGTLPTNLSDIVGFADGAKVEASKIIGSADATPSRATGTQQSASGIVAAADTATATTRPAGSVTASGQLAVRMTNDNTAFAVQPTRRYFDIAFLPDFDEEYVISTHSNFGIGRATIQLGQGWSLQALDATVDNSAITGPLLDAYADAIKLLSAAAKAALTGTPQSAGGIVSGDVKTATLAAGEPVSLRITRVTMAAPGIYPILKPKEYADVRSTAVPAGQSLLLPVPPATNVAFRTFDVLVVEAIPASGDSPYRITEYSTPSSQTSSAGVSDTKTPATSAAPKPADLEKQVQSFVNQQNIKAAVQVVANTDDPKVYVLSVTPAIGATVDANSILKELNNILARDFPSYTAKLKAN